MQESKQTKSPQTRSQNIAHPSSQQALMDGNRTQKASRAPQRNSTPSAQMLLPPSQSAATLTTQQHHTPLKQTQTEKHNDFEPLRQQIDTGGVLPQSPKSVRSPNTGRRKVKLLSENSNFMTTSEVIAPGGGTFGVEAAAQLVLAASNNQAQTFQVQPVSQQAQNSAQGTAVGLSVSQKKQQKLQKMAFEQQLQSQQQQQQIITATSIATSMNGKKKTKAIEVVSETKPLRRQRQSLSKTKSTPATAINAPHQPPSASKQHVASTSPQVAMQQKLIDLMKRKTSSQVSSSQVNIKHGTAASSKSHLALTQQPSLDASKSVIATGPDSASKIKDTASNTIKHQHRRAMGEGLLSRPATSLSPEGGALAQYKKLPPSSTHMLSSSTNLFGNTPQSLTGGTKGSTILSQIPPGSLKAGQGNSSSQSQQVLRVILPTTTSDHKQGAPQPKTLKQALELKVGGQSTAQLVKKQNQKQLSKAQAITMSSGEGSSLGPAEKRRVDVMCVTEAVSPRSPLKDFSQQAAIAARGIVGSSTEVGSPINNRATRQDYSKSTAYMSITEEKGGCQDAGIVDEGLIRDGEDRMQAMVNQQQRDGRILHQGRSPMMKTQNNSYIVSKLPTSMLQSHSLTNLAATPSDQQKMQLPMSQTMTPISQNDESHHHGRASNKANTMSRQMLHNNQLKTRVVRGSQQSSVVVGAQTENTSDSQFFQRRTLAPTPSLKQRGVKVLHLPANDQSRERINRQIVLAQEEAGSQTPLGSSAAVAARLKGEDFSYVDQGFLNMVDFYAAQDDQVFGNRQQRSREGVSASHIGLQEQEQNSSTTILMQADQETQLRQATMLATSMSQANLRNGSNSRSRLVPLHKDQSNQLRKSLQALPPLGNGKQPNATTLLTQQLVQQKASANVTSMTTVIPNKLGPSLNNSGANSRDSEAENLRNSRFYSSFDQIKGAVADQERTFQEAVNQQSQFQATVKIDANNSQAHPLVQSLSVKNLPERQLSTSSLSRLNSDLKVQASHHNPKPEFSTVNITAELRKRALSRNSSKKRKVIDCSPEPATTSKALLNQQVALDRQVLPQVQAYKSQPFNDSPESKIPLHMSGKQDAQRPLGMSSLKIDSVTAAENDDVSQVTTSLIAAMNKQRVSTGMSQHGASTSDRLHQHLAIFQDTGTRPEDKATAFTKCLKAIAEMQINRGFQEVLITLSESLPSLLHSVASEAVQEAEKAKDQVIERLEKTILDLQHCMDEPGTPSTPYQQQLIVKASGTELRQKVALEEDKDGQARTTSNASTDKKDTVLSSQQAQQYGQANVGSFSNNKQGNNNNNNSTSNGLGFQEFMARFDSGTFSEQTNRRQQQQPQPQNSAYQEGSTTGVFAQNNTSIQLRASKVPALRLPAQQKIAEVGDLSHGHQVLITSGNRPSVGQRLSGVPSSNQSQSQIGVGNRVEQLAMLAQDLQRDTEDHVRTLAEVHEEAAMSNQDTVMRTQLTAVLSEHLVRTERRGVLELSWDHSRHSDQSNRDLTNTLQQSLECVCIRDASLSGNRRTTLLTITPASIRQIGSPASTPQGNQSCKIGISQDRKAPAFVKSSGSQSHIQSKMMGGPAISSKKKKPQGLKLGKVVGRAALDFQDEFMGKYDEFSQSWRDQIDRQKRF